MGPSLAAHAIRVKGLVAKVLGAEAVQEHCVSVQEVACTTCAPDGPAAAEGDGADVRTVAAEGCSDVETLVVVFDAQTGQQTHMLRVPKPLADVQEDDVKAAVAAEALPSPPAPGGDVETTCSCCEPNLEKQLTGCSCCHWQFLVDENVRVNRETGQRVSCGPAEVPAEAPTEPPVEPEDPTMAASMEVRTISVLVRTLQGQEFPVMIGASTSVSQVKQLVHIASEGAWPPALQRLLLRGCELHDDETAAGAGIEPGDLVYVFRRVAR